MYVVLLTLHAMSSINGLADVSINVQLPLLYMNKTNQTKPASLSYLTLMVGVYSFSYIYLS
jgi:hypothetical protein